MTVRFSGSVTFERATIRTYGGDGRPLEKRVRTAPFGSFRNAEARIDDDRGWKRMTVDVWIKPDPSQGSCYDHLLVRGSDLRSDRPGPDLEAPRICLTR